MEASATPGEHGFLGDRRWRPTIYYEEVFWRCPCKGCTFTLMRGADPPRKLLDGFLLLEACHVEFPDEATPAVLHSRNVADVAPEDLQYFNNLAYLDLGANRVRLEMLPEQLRVDE